MNSIKLLIISIITSLLTSMTSILCNEFNGNYLQDCGDRPRNLRTTRIIGGTDTFYGEVPWQVLLHVKVNNAIMQCGGVLIDPNWILTAAHCIDVSGGHCLNVEAFFGKHRFKSEDIESQVSDQLLNEKRRTKDNYNDYDKPFVTRNVTKIIINDNFNRNTLESDIALIKLNQSITNDDNIQPICLPKQLDDFTGQSAYISGFGVLRYGSNRVPRILQIVSVPILSKHYCNELFERMGHKNVVKTGKLCAGVIDGGRDACAGDSGGPLAVKRSEDNKWVLAGIISNGIKCGQPYTPGVYTQVSAFVDWINAVINS